MSFWDEVNHGSGYAIDVLSGYELALVRTLIRNQYLTAICDEEPDSLDAAVEAGLERYHEREFAFDHGTFWEKSRRVLPALTVPSFESMGFFRRIRRTLPSAQIYADDLMWRIVRPSQPSDVGPVHADKWFWDAGNGVIDGDRERLKVWMALYTEPGLNGLSVKPYSQKSDRWKRHFEFKHGTMKPVLDENEADLDMQPLSLVSGELAIFHDGLLHGGVVNRASTCRVSLELTVTYLAAEGADRSRSRMAA